MMTFDAFLGTEEIVAVMTGLPMDTPPVLIDRASGASVACQPTRLSGLGSLGLERSSVAPPGALRNDGGLSQ